MARPATKKDLIGTAGNNFGKLHDFINSMTEKELSLAFDFSGDEKKKEAHWRRDKSLKDLLIHLYEWHQLLLNWVGLNMKGENAAFLPAPYTWKTYGDMNVEFCKKHQNTKLEESRKLFIESHNDIMSLANKFTNEELFSKDVYNWVGGSTLGSYFVSATASHYEWAIKKLKAHREIVNALF